MPRFTEITDNLFRLHAKTLMRWNGRFWNIWLHRLLFFFEKRCRFNYL